jgi:hypothetical protein
MGDNFTIDISGKIDINNSQETLIDLERIKENIGMLV